MSVFEQLSKNKGTISSALGKTLAQKVLEEGESDILFECIELSSYEASAPAAKNIRAGAAKVVEIVAEKQPELVAPHLEKLLTALTAAEPQTRWMTLRTMGFCAHLNKPAAQKAIAYAEKALDHKEGLVLASSADLFLGDFGALSKEDARTVFPILERSMESVMPNEQDWILEALCKLLLNLEPGEREKARKFAEGWQEAARKSTRQRVRKLLRG
jgi:hypothetical protein